MIIITGISLDRDINALTMPCPDGIANRQGTLVCNLTKSNKTPYVFLQLQEEVEGIIIHQQLVRMWGKLTKSGKAEWGVKPAEFALVKDYMPAPFDYIVRVLNNVKDVREIKEFFTTFSEEERFEYIGIESIEQIPPIGIFITRQVKKYIDGRGREYDSFSCFIFSRFLDSEEKIRRHFSYYGKTVIDASQPVENEEV
jgi:hypothetical protein